MPFSAVPFVVAVVDSSVTLLVAVIFDVKIVSVVAVNSVVVVVVKFDGDDVVF